MLKGQMNKIPSQKSGKTGEMRESKILKRIVKLGKHRKLLLGLQIWVIALHIAGISYGTHGKNISLFKTMNITEYIVQAIDLLRDMVLMVTNIVGFCCFCSSSKLFEMLHSLQNNLTCTICRCIYNVTIILLYFFIILIIACYMYLVNVQFGGALVIYLIPGIVEYGFFNLTLFGTLFFVQDIKEHITSVNGFLQKNIDPHFEANLVGLADDLLKPSLQEKHGAKHMIQCLDNLSYITRHHESVCDMLDILNEKFKGLALLIILSVIVNIIWCISAIIECSVNSYDIGIYAAVLFLIKILIAMGQAALAAWVGEQIDQEGHQTVKVCLSLTNKLATAMPMQVDERIEKQLRILLDQSKSRKVYLHSGGFFRLNWGILGMVTSTVATYTIVIIQFYASNNFK